MQTTYGPARLTVVLETDQQLGGGIIVWRIVRTDLRDDPVFVNSFCSNYELGQPPRKVERSASVIHMGISTYLDRVAAAKTALMWEKLGDYVAKVHLAPGRGFNYAFTGPKGHLTIWGDPVKLSEQAVEIFQVER